jgi:hypothetical protein
VYFEEQEDGNVTMTYKEGDYDEDEGIKSLSLGDMNND